MRVTVLAGGYGGAKLSHGLALESARRVSSGGDPIALDIIVNTGDDLLLHGLHVAPDLDTVMYTLAGLANDETGWGVREETWSAAAQLERYGAPTWFRLGDRDLATHIRRTELLREGVRLTEVTLALAAALGVKARLLPMSDQPVRSEILTDKGWLEFQDYFVRRGHRDEVREIRQVGIDTAHPTPEVFDAIRAADLIVFAPSNPFVSIGTILALRGMTDALAAAPARIVAVSPIVAGEALRGPADQMLASLGGEASATGVATHYKAGYSSLLDAFVIDSADAGATAEIQALGLEVLATGTVMRDHEDRRRLAVEILDRFAPTGG
jgi:LPPG:FO 2-phospho-L-lactate transferase